MIIKQLTALIPALLIWLPSQHVYAASCPTFAPPVSTGQLSNLPLAGVSGFAASRTSPGAVWVHNDGGAGIDEAGVFYAITGAGNLLGKWTVADISNMEQEMLRTFDVEDIAVGVGPAAGTYLYLGDIGGNRSTPFGRSTIRIMRLPEPRVDVRAGTQPDAVVTDASILTFAYPNDERYDAETLMVDTNGDIYVVTKDSKQGESHIFYVSNLPEGQTTATMTQVATLQFGSGALMGSLSATAGDISSRGSEAIIRTYNRVFLWQKDENSSWAKTFAESTPCELPSAPSRQYEAIAFDRAGIHVYDTYEPTDEDAMIQRYRRKPDGSKIKVYAAGRATPDNVYPTVELLINDVSVATFVNVQGDPAARVFQTLTYQASGSVSADQVKVRFANDNGSRDLRVDKISINGVQYQSEAPSTYSTGAWIRGQGCTSGNVASEWLYCGGYLEFK